MTDHSKWQVARLADAVASPWRNGGGVTRELAVWPDARDWAWRISVADVEQDGPFSSFDGVARHFAVLSGAGVRLDVDGTSHALDATSAPFAFDGGVRTGCTLIAGATRDFNLMTVRSRAHAQMRRVAGTRRHTLAEPAVLAVYVLASGGTLQVEDDAAVALPPHSLAWRALPSGAGVALEAQSALWMEITTAQGDRT